MAKIDLTKYGITGTTEIVYNPSYEVLFEEETKAGLEGLYTISVVPVMPYLVKSIFAILHLPLFFNRAIYTLAFFNL